MSNRSIRPLDWTLSGATTLGLSGPGSNGNKRVHSISKSSSITGASPSACLVSYLGPLLGGGLPLCRDAVGVFFSPSWLGWFNWSRKSQWCLVSNIRDCDVVIDLELQLHNYIYFQINILGKGMNSLMPPSYGLNSTTTVLQR